MLYNSTYKAKFESYEVEPERSFEHPYPFKFKPGTMDKIPPDGWIIVGYFEVPLKRQR
jgi:hypothetical protein